MSLDQIQLVKDITTERFSELAMAQVNGMQLTAQEVSPGHIQIRHPLFLSSVPTGFVSLVHKEDGPYVATTVLPYAANQQALTDDVHEVAKGLAFVANYRKAS